MRNLFCFLLTLFFAVHADRVYLSSGEIVDGDIIGKSEVIIKIYNEAFHRAMMIEKEMIDSIEMEGRIYTFATLDLNRNAYNPKFKVSPRVRRSEPEVKPQAVFEKDLFAEAQNANRDTSTAGARRMNLFFNAPLRLGSIGIGYYQFPGLHDAPDWYRPLGYLYSGAEFSVRCINFQLRKNMRKLPATLVLDAGYGKKSLFEDGGVEEYATYRYLSGRYVFCNHRWLFAPGLYAGFLLQAASIFRVNYRPDSSSSSRIILEEAMALPPLRPLLGLDFNLYDVVTVLAGFDPLRFSGRRITLALSCQMPFVQ